MGLGATCITKQKLFITKYVKSFFFSTIWPINHQLFPFVSNLLHQIQQLLRSTGGLLRQSLVGRLVLIQTRDSALSLGIWQVSYDCYSLLQDNRGLEETGELSLLHSLTWPDRP